MLVLLSLKLPQVSFAIISCWKGNLLQEDLLNIVLWPLNADMRYFEDAAHFCINLCLISRNINHKVRTLLQNVCKLTLSLCDKNRYFNPFGQD